jgi:uncharacterized membrane protein
VLWTLVGVVILNWSVTLFGPASYFPPVALLVVLTGFWGVAVIIISWLDIDKYPALERWSGWFAWANAILIVILIGVWTYLQLHNNPGYSTDEQSFDQYAAQLVAHGFHNPYTHSMQPAVPLFRLSPDAYTYTITGKPVTVMSYPSLSFLVYVPFLLLGWMNEVGPAMNVMAWALAILLMFALLPRNMRAAALVLSSIDVYLSFASGGVTDMLYIPLLIVAAYKWDLFGTTRRSYIGPVAVGLAMSIKQTPWPVVAFVVCAIAWDEYDRSGDAREAARRAGRYLAVVVGVFLLPNLPYMIASPHGWFGGVLAPFTKNLVPSGQGVISLTLFAHLGGGSLLAYTAGLVLVAVLTLLVFVGTYPLLRPATFMLPTIAYFFAARSQTNYLIPLVPVGIVGAVTCGRAVRPALGPGSRVAGLLRSRKWAGAIGVTAALSAAAIIYGLVAPSPLAVKVTGIRATGFLGGINELHLLVHNGTGKPMKPAYTIQTIHGDTTFWDRVGGPGTIAPGKTVKIDIIPPNGAAQQGLSDGFSVLAYTDKPAAVSVSHRFLLNLYRTAFTPQTFNNAIPVGKHIKLQIQVLDHFDNPVKKAGIPFILTQLLYVPLGTAGASARIDGHRAGKGQITGYTNKHGVVTYDIVGTKPTTVPISFSGHLLNKSAGYIYGSPGFLLVRFKRNPALERKLKRQREQQHKHKQRQH